MLAIEYRIYSRATKGGGAVIKSTSAGGGVVKSTSAGGGTTATSSSGGGVAKSTASGGGSSQTSSAGGGTSTTSGFSSPGFYIWSSNPYNIGGLPDYPDHVHAVEVTNQLNHSHSVTIGNHSHSVTIPAHTHEFDVPNHSHSVTISNHIHEIDVPAHIHDINLPDHAHDIEHGIFKLSRMPSKVTIKVDGKTVSYTALAGESIDLIPYLALDSEKRVKRGWHTVEITPNDLARINAQLMVQFFMQSRGGVDA